MWAGFIRKSRFLTHCDTPPFPPPPPPLPDRAQQPRPGSRGIDGAGGNLSLHPEILLVRPRDIAFAPTNIQAVLFRNGHSKLRLCSENSPASRKLKRSDSMHHVGPIESRSPHRITVLGLMCERDLRGWLRGPSLCRKKKRRERLLLLWRQLGWRCQVRA